MIDPFMAHCEQLSANMGRQPSAMWAKLMLFAIAYQFFCTARISFLSKQRIHTFKVLISTSLCSGSSDEDKENIGVSSGIIGIPTKNVLGGRLQACCFQPKTGFYRVGATQQLCL